MRVNRIEFLEALARVEAGRSQRPALEQSNCYIFSQSWCTTFNDELCCRTKVNLPQDFTGAVVGGPLKTLIENFPDDEIDLVPVRNNAGLQVRGRRRRAEVRMEAEILLPIDDVSPPEKWVPIDKPDEFAQAIKQVSGACGTSDEEFLTVCIHLTPDGLEACDRSQAVRYEMTTGVTRPFLVRAKALTQVAQYQMTKIGETVNWVHFRNKTLIYSCRRYIEDFMDLAPLWGFRGSPMVLPKGAVEAARIGAIFSGEDKENDRVTVRISEGHMVVRGEGSYGWAESDLETNFKGDPFSFRIGPALLEKIVHDHNSCEIGPGKMRITGENWQYLTSLGKVDPNAPAEVTVPVEDEGSSDEEVGDSDDE